jgi:hypothetical protein
VTSTGIEPRDFPACSLVPQPNTLPCGLSSDWFNSNFFHSFDVMLCCNKCYEAYILSFGLLCVIESFITIVYAFNRLWDVHSRGHQCGVVDIEGTTT